MHLTATGGGAATFALTVGSLPPAGLTIDPAGLVSGIPLSPGLSELLVRAIDPAGCAGSQVYELAVDP